MKRKFNKKQQHYKLFVCLLLTFAFAWPARAQWAQLKEKINLDQQSASALRIIETIDQQSEYTFTFVQEQLSAINVPALKVKDMPLGDVLALLQKKYGLQFQVNDRNIAVKAGPVKQPMGKLTGRLTDAENGQPVIGASVRAGNKATVSDTNGVYTFQLAEGEYELVISFVGYARTVMNVAIKEEQTTELSIPLKRDKGQLGEVTVRADRIITSNNRQLLHEIRTSTGVVSGISSEQITISVDRSATEVARRVSGITLQDGFISVRGMTPRYNPVFLNNAFLPSTDPNKRAFNFDLLPSSVIDKMLVYKSAAPELPGDFAGGVIKVYTKKSVPIRRLEIGLQTQYRTGNRFFDHHTAAQGGRYDWLGYDDGTRTMPQNMPRNQYGQIILPDVPTVKNGYTHTNEVVTDALLQRSTKSWNLQQRYHPADLQGDITYYTYANIGRMKLSSVSVGRYEYQRQYYWTNTAINANRYRNTEFPTDGTPLTPFYQANYRLAYDSVYSSAVRLAAMQHFSLIINPNNEIQAMGLFNRNTKEVLQINTLKEWYNEEKGSLFFRRMENAYNAQDIYLGMLSGSHKLSGGRQQLEWTTSYSKALTYDPNQFSNVYWPDEGSIVGDAFGTGSLNITDQTQWQLYTGTRRNVVVGRFSDGQGDETRWQGNLDYTIHPSANWKDLFFRGGAYFEKRRKHYFFSGLAFRDYPEMPFTPDPWDKLGDLLQQQLAATGARMHTGIQYVGLAGAETNGYEASFDNTAGYVAANVPLHFGWLKLDVYGGVRLEHSFRKVLSTTGQELLQEYVRNTAGEMVVVGTAPPAYQHFWLPSVSATWHLHDVWQLRLSYGKTLNRPDLRELSPFLTYKPADGYTYIGRSTLRDAKVDNYDLRLEWYPSPGETVSAGVYYKYINSPIEETMALTNTGIPGFTHSNLPFARITGAELEVRKRLDFIDGDIFRDMGFILNACYNHTEASNFMPLLASDMTNYYPGGTLRSFMGAAPWIVNAGLFYDNKSAGSRFSLQYNVCGDRLLAGTSGTTVAELEPQIFERSRHLLDISLLQKVNKWLSVRAAAQNLLNSPIRRYSDGDFNKRFNTEPSLFSWDLYYREAGAGDVNKVTTKMIQGDYYTRDYREGVYFTLGFQVSL